jgi:sugar lactone lactonase YvrE
MSVQQGRYTATKPIGLAEGWSFTRLTAPSRLFGANGLRTGPDGRVYIAQVAGSQISALDVVTGQVETISPKGSDIVAPDDVAFDPQGNLYATEYYDSRVSVRDRAGRTRVLRDDIPGANGITFHKGRLFVDECRIGGRLMELDLNGGAPRVLLENLPMPNAMEVGPDGKLYYPMIGTNDIWRIDPEGGTPERVAGDLGVPTSVKFDAKGFIVSTQVHSGEVLRIDPRNGERTVLAKIAPGIDNLTFVGDSLFVSHFTGLITEIKGSGQTRAVLPGGLNWPMGLALAEDGTLFVADGHHFFGLQTSQKSGELKTLGMLFSAGFPGFIRGVISLGGGELVVTTSVGTIARYRPAKNESEVLAHGLDQVCGVARSPGGVIVAAEIGTGRVVEARGGQAEVVASGLRKPMDVAFSSDGTCFVSESGAGRVVKLKGSSAETVLDGLKEPQGIVVHDNQLFVLDVGAKTLIASDLQGKSRQTIVSDLPIGAPAGVVPKPLRGIAPFTGPQDPFAGITAGPDGTLYVSADAEGSVLQVRKTK